MLEQTAKLAKQTRDGRTLAFVALRYPDGTGDYARDDAVAEESPGGRSQTQKPTVCASTSLFR
jgi:hypothetical protein